MANDHRHHDGVASFLLMPYNGCNASAAAAQPMANQNVNFARATNVMTSADTSMVPSSKPPTVMAACDPNVPPISTIFDSQKLSNAPFCPAANRQVSTAMQP